MADLSGVQALLFDVFGTVVDWHGSVTRELAALGREHGIGTLRSVFSIRAAHADTQTATGARLPGRGGGDILKTRTRGCGCLSIIDYDTVVCRRRVAQEGPGAAPGNVDAMHRGVRTMRFPHSAERA